ncbi:hypothetical protein Hbl1158_15890 (plasmid) [Halobaculum sp. CBA1158]|uniref:DUF7344 domain-containing protein n=1 Tax=Halobaculum sp. CBA1158 TaxID=2904243 RepID=UPI001F37A9C8|nr:hypothetical protein [Halobaculum sp. CBA1158]UIP01389.1 hypothetical protein Hbl1158_15890 [Halobaculum sp. CBA1158]
MTGDGSENGADRPRSSPSLRAREEPSESIVFEAACHARRRELCRLLDETETDDLPMSLADAAMALASREQDVPEAAVTNYEWERVYAALYHGHVPKLDELNVVDYDQGSETVAPGEHLTPVVEAISAVRAAVDDAATAETDAADSPDPADSSGR